MTPEQIVAFVAALVAPDMGSANFPVVQQGGADPRYAVRRVACPKPMAPLEIEGKTFICGMVSVPEDHDRPDGRRLELEFSIYKARSAAPARDAIVHLHGGPGGGIVEAVALTSVFFEKLRQRRDIVAFDQRGVDASGRETRCVSTVAANVKDLADGVSSKRGLPPAIKDRLMAECVAELKSHGMDVTKINTEQNARDVQAVMRALGYPVYNVYGISYGTKLGLEVMRTAPDGLRAVVLDSVAPPHIPTYDTLATPYVESIEWTFTQCAADPACAAAYPDLKTRFWALVDKLDAKPVQLGTAPVTGSLLFQIVASRNNWRGPRGMTAYIPKMVAELEKDVTTTLDALTQETLPPRQTADTVLDGVTGLTADQLALARIALALSKQTRETEGALKLALQQLEADRNAAAQRASVAAVFDAQLEQAAKAIAGRDARLAFARDYLALRPKTPAAGPLLALLRAHIGGDARGRLEALVATMTSADLAEVFRRVGADNVALEKALSEDFELMLFMCQEDMDINSIAGARAEHARLGLPKSIAAEFEESLNVLYTGCAALPVVPRKGFHDPVTSPVPTLVFSGTLDTQTATSWGPETARHLPNGRSIVFPETGHGALAFSACAQDLGVAFIENPTAQLDTSCVAALAPRFVMP